MAVRFESLQALRGVACLLVVVYHVAGVEAKFGTGFAPFRPALWFGFAGVDLFFVLSGFIIAATCRADLGKPGRVGGFLFRRAWRIFPVYWVVLALGVAWHVATCPDPLPARQWRAELTDSLFLLPQTSLPRFLSVAWSLSFELMFYLGFALLFLLPRRAAPVALAGWGLAVLGAGAGGFAPTNRFAALVVHPYVLEFLAGCVVAWVPARFGRRVALRLVAVAAAWCAAGLALASRGPQYLEWASWARVVVFGMPAALVVLAFTGWERGGGRFRRGRLSRVGDASYSIYLIHWPALLVGTYLSMWANVSHSRVPHCAWLAAMVAAGVVPGLLLHRYVEAPLLRLGKRRTAPVETARPAPARAA